jgi:integrase
VLGEEEWTPHDLRRTGATMMQKLKIPRDVINLCQNHVIGSKVDRHYLLHDYADEKREAWYKLGDKLEEILEDSNVIYLKTHAS